MNRKILANFCILAAIILLAILALVATDNLTLGVLGTTSLLDNFSPNKYINNTHVEGKWDSMPWQKRSIGAWVPDQPVLQEMNGIEQVSAIQNFLKQGFSEYYYVMSDYTNHVAASSTERLLKSADQTGLRVVIILLPPSEGGPNGNYYWLGWVNYFNVLKANHKQSFQGFAIDDFNWISTRSDTRYKRNIDFMTYSNLTTALEHKRRDVLFYPVIYFEGEGTINVIKQYTHFAGGIIMASACYYNITHLERQIELFRTMFKNNSTRYMVYPTITYNYTKRHYPPPTNRLVMATLSIATKSTNGIIIWHDITNHVVKNYLAYRQNPSYESSLSIMENEQRSNENFHQERNQTRESVGCSNWYDNKPS